MRPRLSLSRILLSAALLGACGEEEDTGTAPDTGEADTEDTDDTDPPEDTGEDCEDPLEWFYDADGDGFGDPDLTALACDAPAGFVELADDCDDVQPDVHPGVADLCNGIDDDCDDLVDEDAATSTWYADLDGDGFGDPDNPAESCAAPEGYVADDSDCDDAEELTFPGATDVACDGIDHDCDGVVWTCAPEGSRDLEAEALRVEGLEAGAGLGDTAHVADIDLDGVDDLLLGALEGNGGTGSVHAWLGPITADTDTSEADLVFSGATSGDDFGSAILGGLDGDADGYEDLLLGAGEGTMEEGGYTYSRGGMLYWFAGPVTGGSLAADDADFAWEGQSTSRSATLLVPGDFDGDGTEDVAISAPNVISAAHKLSGVWLLTAPFDMTDERLVWVTTLTLAPDDNSGGAYGLGAGDVNGDGVDDLVVSDEHEVTGNTGVVHLMHGPITTTSYWTTDGISVPGTSTGQLLGAAIDVGDLDGDGYADLLLGAPADETSGTAGAGAAYLVSGGSGSLGGLSSATAQFTCELTSAGLGSTVHIVDDVNQDGVPDVLIGGPKEDDGAGASWLMVSPFSGTLDAEADAQARFDTGDYDRISSSLSMASDLTGDGAPDIVVGASTDQASSEAGAAWIFPFDSGY